jgi:RNA polymerase sigma-70 factor (ECF subfamily)
MNLYFRGSKYKPSSIHDVHIYLPYEEGIETEKAALAKAFQENKEFMAVQQQLLRMDIKYQEVISLRFFEEKSIKEIADILGKNEGTVKSLLSRGLDKLRALVEKKLQPFLIIELYNRNH